MISLLFPDIAIPVGDGFLMPTEYRTIARYQLAIGADNEYPLLRMAALANSRARKPRTLKVLQVIVRKIEADIKDKDGKDTHAKSEMSEREVARCREWFRNYQDLVFVYTGGALQVEPSELVIDNRVTKLDEMGGNAYWMSGYNAAEANDKRIRENYYDNITFYYKKPETMKAGLLGGAIGRDYGIRGSAFWTQWITDWNEPPSVFSGPGVVSFHEWLHNVSYYAHRVMRYTAIPDCHAAEEYGYWDQDGGYKQWQAWNRDLTLYYIPRAFWYKLNTRGQDLGEAPLAINSSVKAGKFYNWDLVKDDWQALLPELSDAQLQSLTGIADLNVEVHQSKPNSNMNFRLKTERKTGSAYFADDISKAQVQFDNVLLLGRREKPSRRSDPYGGYADAPLEGMAVLRNPSTPRGRRDLLLLRPDIASAVLPLLKTERDARSRIIGFLHKRDPAEGQQVNLIAALVDFGDKVPADELAAIGR